MRLLNKILVLFICLFASVAFADVDTWNGTPFTDDTILNGDTVTQWNGQTVKSSDCPSGTYTFYWDGDHSTDENYACVDSGNSTQDVAATDGTDRVNTTAGETGQGFQKTGADQYLQWTVTAGNLVNATQSTIWMSVKLPAVGENTTELYETWVDGTDNIHWRIAANETHQGLYDGGAEDDVQGTSVMSAATWYRIAYTWQADTGADDHCVNTCDSAGENCSGWECSAVALSGWTGITDLRIGNLDAVDNAAHNPYIDNVYITNGYQDVDPKFN